jgi:hypothetical protein
MRDRRGLLPGRLELAVSRQIGTQMLSNMK